MRSSASSSRRPIERRQAVALDHHHLDPEVTRRRYLAVGGRTAAVLGDDDVDPVRSSSSVSSVCAKGPEAKMAGDIRQTRAASPDRRCDDVAVLRRLLEMVSLLPADCQQDAAGSSPMRTPLRDASDAGPSMPGSAARRGGRSAMSGVPVIWPLRRR